MDASTNTLRRIAQVPIRVGAMAVFALSGILAVGLLPAGLLWPVLALPSALLTVNALVALRVAVTSLGVIRVPRRTLVLVVVGNAWLWASLRPDDAFLLELAAGLSCAVALGAFVLDVGYRTPLEAEDAWNLRGRLVDLREGDEVRQRTVEEGVRVLGCFALVATVGTLFLAFPSYVLSGDIWAPVSVVIVAWTVGFSFWTLRRR